MGNLSPCAQAAHRMQTFVPAQLEAEVACNDVLLSIEIDVAVQLHKG